MKKKLVFIMLTLNIILLYCNNSFSEDIIYFYDPSNVYVKLYDSVSHVRYIYLWFQQSINNGRKNR